MEIFSLIKASYYDSKTEVRLEAYADTVVIEQEGNISYLAAIRLGGYPESVKGMSEAIYGGGTVNIDIDGEQISAYSRVKQYRKEFSHDGIYAEATLLIQDNEQQTDHEKDAKDNTKTFIQPRKCYLFCEQNNIDQLFEELDKKIAVPMIPEFQDYVLMELQKRDILKQLRVISCRENFDVWVLDLSKDEENVIAVVNDGLKSGAIKIPCSNSNKFPAVQSVTQYLNTFGVMIAERIKNQFNPLFDPATEALSSEILAINEYIKKTAGYSLYNAQLAVCEAHKRCLEQTKATLCVSECGSGKSKIGITALHAHQEKRKKSKHFNIILCPSHMTKKWVREIEESLPNTFATVITSVTDLNKIYKVYQQDSKTCYIIISKEKARDGYMKRPAATWNERRKAFICPTCYEPIMMVWLLKYYCFHSFYNTPFYRVFL